MVLVRLHMVLVGLHMVLVRLHMVPSANPLTNGTIHSCMHSHACIYASKHACIASIYTYKHTYIHTYIHTHKQYVFDGDERVRSENIIEHLMEYMPEYRYSSMCSSIMFGAKMEGGRKL